MGAQSKVSPSSDSAAVPIGSQPTISSLPSLGTSVRSASDVSTRTLERGKTILDEGIDMDPHGGNTGTSPPSRNGTPESLTRDSLISQNSNGLTQEPLRLSLTN